MTDGDTLELADESWGSDMLANWATALPALQELEPFERIALVSKYWVGHSWEEVAELLGGTCDQARYVVKKARRALAKHLR